VRLGAPRSWGALAFLLPAAVLLGALVAYPIVFTVVRSLYDRSGSAFVGADNYATVFTNGRTLIALRNNVIWVVVAPSVVTSLGLIFAVLSERVSWQTAFKIVVFLPMAISFLAAGVIFRLVYEQDPQRGVANAVVTSVVDTFREPGRYPGARLRDGVTPSSSIPMVGLPPSSLPKDAKQAVEPTPVTKGVAGVVWLDFRPGGGGTPGVIDPGERGLAGMKVEAVRAGKVVATATADSAGRFVLDQPGDVRLAASNFREPFRGVRWLGPALVTPSVIGAYVWVWAGFAMVVIAAGLAAIPREVLEAARVDGATEWQVFRRVTVPLLAPVLAVVFVTLVINVLKVFDLVLIIPPGSVQDDANVLALEMWRVSFGGARDQGLGSALGVVLFVLVLPAMAFNVRRFRREDDR
jgi:alpha-glucoside transport system permease protein